MTAITGRASTDGRPHVPDDVSAAVLTHLRPTLAGDVVRGLLGREGIAPQRVVVVVNGSGGLDDPRLEAQVRMVRLAENRGPAGGFHAALCEAFADPSTHWAYLCEDDVGLFDLPSPRLAGLVERVERAEATGEAPAPVGAVVAYGRVFVGRGGHTVNVVPTSPSSGGLVPVDVACWGAALVSRRTFDAGILPDPEWFFGLEDFDFFCRVRAAGLSVLMDETAAHRVAVQQTDAGRESAIRGRRPVDAEEPWRAYYHARNSFALARRHGRPSWLAWQLGYSARRVQKASSSAERSAILYGVRDGMLGRLGENQRYRRDVGERDREPGNRPPNGPSAGRPAGGTP